MDEDAGIAEHRAQLQAEAKKFEDALDSIKKLEQTSFGDDDDEVEVLDGSA